MTNITFANYEKLLYDGARVIYGERAGIVERDSGWNGGFKIGGRSIRNLLEEFDVMLID
jgi:hypothetical protein